jgi:hypothetical protein
VLERSVSRDTTRPVALTMGNNCSTTVEGM